VNEILPGVWHWTVRHPRIGIEVSSHWLDEDGVAIDPLLPPEGLEFFRSRTRSPSAVLLSNRHHYRHAGALADAFGARVLCSRPGMHEFEAEQAVEPFDFGDALPGGVTAFEVGAICPDDTAFHIPAARALLLADAIVDGGLHGGDHGLGFVSDSLMDDPERTKQGILAAARRALDELEFDHLLMAHGLPLIGDGRERLQAFVDEGGRTAFEM
jgi:glyoxylase-like metal-dependent hydrolase (beta-lactamase superfamily II)